MNNVKHGIAHRLLAAFMALVLIFGMLPVSTIPVYAATTEHPDAVTISVVDAEGNPIEGASVNYTINSVANGDAYIAETKTTDEYGVVEVLEATAFVADDLTISATVTKDGYVSGTVASTAIVTSDQNIVAAMGAVIHTIDNVTITETPWTYDGDPHTLVSVAAQKGDVIKYRLGDGEVTKTVPTATDAGTYIVTVYVERDGYKSIEKTVVVEVGKAAIPVVLAGNTGLVYNGKAKKLVTLSGVKTTDQITWTVNGETTGSREIPVGTDAKTYIVTVSVERDDPNYIDFTDTVTVEIEKAEIKGVSLKAIEGLTYTGADQALVALSGVLDSDDIKWTVNEEATGSEDIPTRLAVGTYNITLIVNRGENYIPLEIAKTVVIGKAEIDTTGLQIEGLCGIYSGEAQRVVTVEGAGSNYTIWYQIDPEIVDGTPIANDTAWTTEIPTKTDAGSYVVLVKVTSDSNHSDKEVAVTPAADAVTPYNVYIASKRIEKPVADNTVFVFNNNEQVYGIAESNLYTVTGNKQTNAGEYTVMIALNDKSNYAWADGTTDDLNFVFVIDKAPQSLSFNNSEYADGSFKNVTIYGTGIFDFGTTKEAFEGNKVVYSVGEGTDDGIAQISTDGRLTVADAGTVNVVAALAGNENYHGVSISCTLRVTEGVSDESKLISFASDNVSYIFGAANGVVSSQSVMKRYNQHQRDNDPTYSIDERDIGLAIDSKTGAVTVSDYEKLGRALTENNGSVVVTVTANKAEVKRNGWVLYAADTDSYTLTISFRATPDSAYVLSGSKGAIDEVDTNWYVSAVTAVPADRDKYTISRGFLPSDFDNNVSNSVVFSNQGSAVRYVYLRHNDTGEITAAIPVNINIDTEISKPNISYSTGVGEAFLKKLTFGFYNPDVTVTVELTDATSGIDHFDYSYAVQEGVSQINVGGRGVLSGDDIDIVDGKATASFKIPAQFRGYVTVAATDKAGNTAQTADEKVVVVDSIAPNVKVAYSNNSVVNGIYYSAARSATICVDEANFFMEDVSDSRLEIKVGAEYNNGVSNTEVLKPEFREIGSTDIGYNSEFDTDGDGFYYVATIEFNKDADYTFDIKYADLAGNEAAPYHAEFTVDLTDPVVVVEVTNDDVWNEKHFNADRIAYITVTEHNFDPAGFVATITENGVPMTADLEWDCVEGKACNGDTHTAKIAFSNDAHYMLAFACSDLSGRKDQNGPDYGGSIAPDKFTIDKTKPTGSISYSEPESYATLLEVLTFGFYKSEATVYVEFTDVTSGVKQFAYTCTVQNGASEINKGLSGTIAGDDITCENGIYKASFTVPAQFRGEISVTATDRANWTTTATYNTDFEIIVVDNIAPNVEVSYRRIDTKENIDLQDGTFYPYEIEAVIEITEANFFVEDWRDDYLVITKTKDGVEEELGNLSFDTQGDLHTAVIPFETDADYTFDIKYTDRSGNVFDSYNERRFTVDLTDPIVEVEITNDDVHNGEYFNAERTAYITVKEHNFVPDGFVATITENGVPMTVDIEWDCAEGKVCKDDIHIAKIEFAGDAHYVLEFDYTDMAGRKDEDGPAYGDSVVYSKFTVDKTAPTDLMITYGEAVSVWHDLLEAVTLGFYQTPIEVTIKANDPISGIDYFEYSYLVEDGASKINEGGNGIITRKDITYDEGGAATATFVIPVQFRGYVSFSAKDKAGNESSKSDELVEMVVADTIAPFVEVTYDNKDAKVVYDVEKGKDVYYYNANRTATITINEANFFAADQADGYLVITVGKTLNDGTYTETVVQPTFTSNGDVHTASVLFEENADYTFDIKYTDRSGNVFDSYEMDEFTIDKIAPVIDITYSNNTAKNNDQFQADRAATIVITEHNFKASDVAATVMASVEPFNGSVSSESYKLVESYTQYLADDVNWKHEGDVHTAVIEYTEEAHYTFTIACSDMAGNDNAGVNYGGSAAPEAFTLDKTAPTGLAITIDDVSVVGSKRTIIFDKFYDHEITVKLDANCDISGLESMQYQKVAAVADVKDDNWTDYNQETGIVVAPSEKFILYFRAEDRAGNVTLINSTGIVVDDQEPVGETDAPDIIIVPDEPNENGIHNDSVNVQVQVIDPAYLGDVSDENGHYSGLKQVTYRVYAEDSNQELTGVLLSVGNEDQSKDLVDDGAVIDWDNLVNRWSGMLTIPAGDGPNEFNSNNVVVEITAVDNAGNVRVTSTIPGEIQIDMTDPQIHVAYNNNSPDSVSYYSADRIATITVYERNLDTADIVITITKDGEEFSEYSISDWETKTGIGNLDDTAHTANITYHEDGDYTFAIECRDLAERNNAEVNYGESATPAEFTIDKTNPVIRVAYNNNDAESGKYFDATRTATVTITEHNFDVDRVTFTRDAARGGTNPNITWAHNGDTHTATIRYTEDGDYTFDVTMTDMAGNNSGAADFGNSVAGKNFVIDTTFENMITIGGVEKGKAYGYSDDVIPTIDISDINLETYTVTLVGIQKDTTIDLTKQINDLLRAGSESVTGTFDIFEVVQDMDGIYTLSLTSKDKAGNQDTEEITFTVNRFGSVYVYDQYLVDLISNGGAYVLSVTDDLIIVEYNADKLVSDSLVIEITCDGKPLENVIYEVTPEINESVAVGESGWYQYKYTISKDNFASDGVYKISVSTKDATGNTPENNRYEDLGITFRVDSTLAEISSIVGLEKAIINATEQVVKYTVYDTMGIKSIKVYVDGQLVDEITDFSADLNNYTGSFTLTEQSAAQSIRIVVEDMSGNITDTDAETFSSAYEFNKSVTVSTNIFVRWYANKPLFWGSIGGVTIVAAGLWMFLMTKCKKKEDK